MIEQQFIEYVVKQLVDNPDAVVVERIVDDRGILLKLTVAPEDLGRVIGKHGATAQSLRNLLRALGTKNDDHYNLKIIDVDKPESERETVSKPTETVVETVTETIEEPEKAATEVEEKVETVEKTDAETVENESDLAKKTREELADLDDLDI
ncbi:KH domain-containing protein [Candidatus Saccharibacteria bacterium]|nr:KH domain-containing protein [Candidatus Saccharibacteria bacterium]